MDTSWLPDGLVNLFSSTATLPESVPWLTLLLALPLIGAIIAMAMKKGRGARWVSAIFSLATFVIVFAMYFYSNHNLGMFDESYTWIETSGITISYALGVDNLSMIMLGLTSFLVFIVSIFSSETERPNLFFAMIMAMQVGLMGVYMAQDYFLFYIMWEVTLIPMFFMISWFGGPRRHYASIKFFIYTHVASLIMLIGIFALVFGTGGNFLFDEVARFAPGMSDMFQTLVFGLLFFGFAVKMPIVPFHTWLPDAHVEAPTAGSVLLAAVMLKMGSYGIIRVCLQNLPDGAEVWQPVMIVIAIVSILYGAYACIAQKDLKKMIAYSSISHMGMVLLGIAMLSEIGLTFAIFQMFAHGLITAVLFMVAGITGHNVGTREIPLLGGLAKRMPKYAGFMVFGFLASLGLPGLVGFVAEFGIMYSFYDYLVGIDMIWLIVTVLLSLMLTAGYYMWAMQRTIFGRETKKVDLTHAHDINKYEVVALSLVCILIVLFGVMPSLVTDMIGDYVTGALSAVIS